MPIDHSSHDHPATAAARSACRKAMQAGNVITKPAVATTPATSKPRKARRPNRYKDVVVPHTEAVKPEAMSDDDWHLLLRNRARFTQSPWPTDEERAASLSKIWCTTCHTLHDLPACGVIPNVPAAQPYVAPAREITIAERKAEAAREAGSKLPTYANANKLAEPIPAGRYAVVNASGDYEFYKIDKPTEGKWAGKVFLKIMASSTEYPIKSAARQMSVYQSILDATPATAMAAYGLQMGRCGDCNRPLTDPESIARGIGPVCAAKHGW